MFMSHINYELQQGISDFNMLVMYMKIPLLFDAFQSDTTVTRVFYIILIMFYI